MFRQVFFVKQRKLSTDPVGGSAIERLRATADGSSPPTLSSVGARMEGYAQRRTGSSPPTLSSVGARLEGYAQRRTGALHRPCRRWERDWKATRNGGRELSTDPASVGARLEGYVQRRTESSRPTLRRWERDWKATCNGGSRELGSASEPP